MINSFKQYLVEESRSVYFTFGRMNPPTIGHGKVLEMLSKKAGKNPVRVFLSQSQDSDSNPLGYQDKVKFARKMFPRHARSIMLNRKIKNVFDRRALFFSNSYIRRYISHVVGNIMDEIHSGLFRRFDDPYLYGFRYFGVVPIVF